MNIKKIAAGTGRFLLRSLTPVPTLKRQGTEIYGSLQRTAQAFQQAGQALHRPTPTPDEIQRAREQEKLSARQQFEAEVAARGLDDNWLHRQWSSIHWTRRAYAWWWTGLSVSGLVMGAIHLKPLWFVLIGAALCIGLFVALAQAARHAWFQWQIERRAYDGFDIFMSQPDFFKRIFL